MNPAQDVSTPMQPERAVHLLIFSTDLDEWPYSVFGTCFIIDWKNRPIILTSSHALGGASPTSVMVAFERQSMSYLPILRVWRPPQESTAKTDAWDFSCLEVKQGVHTACRIDITDVEPIAPETKVMMVGIPKCQSLVDPESGVIFVRPVYFEGTFKEYYEKGQLGMASFSFGNFESIDFMSGSPIFRIEANTGQCHLTGLVIQGSAASGIVRFITIERIVGTLRWLDVKSHWPEPSNAVPRFYH